MRDDTRKLLLTGSALFGAGVICLLLLFFVFGGVTRQGPHRNAGWLLLMLSMGSLPTGSLSLALGALKLFGDRKRG